MMKYPKAEFDNRLKCNVRKTAYDVNSRTAGVVLDVHGFADMDGAINLFSAKDPDVSEIRVWNSDGQSLTPNTVYRRDGDQWDAFAFN